MNSALKPLPRGRHGLSRAQVEASQRLRLVRSMAEVMAEKGYARTSVADVLRRARVSRETFYELFSSKEDCFMSAFEQAYGHIFDAISTPPQGLQAATPEESRLERFSRIFRDYLEALASDPAAARVFLIEVYAAGPSAVTRRLELQAGLTEALGALVGASEEDRFAVEALVAAVVQLVTSRLAVGDTDGLRRLHAPVVSLAARLGLVEAAAVG
jgi:AcrR family transcriptional regulator